MKLLAGWKELISPNSLPIFSHSSFLFNASLDTRWSHLPGFFFFLIYFHSSSCLWRVVRQLHGEYIDIPINFLSSPSDLMPVQLNKN